MINEIVKSNVPESPMRACRPVNCTPGKYSILHYHDEFEFLITYSGSFTAVIDGKKYTANAGEVIFINSHIPHSSESDVNNRHAVLQFRESDYLGVEYSGVIKYSLRLQALSDAPVKIIKSKEVFDLVDSIIQEANDRSLAYELYVKSMVYHLLGYLKRWGILTNNSQIYNTKEVKKILPALDYINNNYQHDISLEETSRVVDFDSSYFCRLFKTATGATFTEYLNFVRVCKAERLLAKTEDSILSISEAVGFSSPSYFNRIFKKYRNCSPRFYRTAKYVAISKGEAENQYYENSDK